jgi:hypothetical protein
MLISGVSGGGVGHIASEQFGTQHAACIDEDGGPTHYVCNVSIK